MQGPLKNDSVLAANTAVAASHGGKVFFEGEQDQADFKKMIVQSKFLLIIHGGGLVGSTMNVFFLKNIRL